MLFRSFSISHTAFQRKILFSGNVFLQSKHCTSHTNVSLTLLSCTTSTGMSATTFVLLQCGHSDSQCIVVLFLDIHHGFPNVEHVWRGCGFAHLTHDAMLKRFCQECLGEHHMRNFSAASTCCFHLLLCIPAAICPRFLGHMIAYICNNIPHFYLAYRPGVWFP